jgi:hypothetical protein
MGVIVYKAQGESTLVPTVFLFHLSDSLCTIKIYKIR